MTAIETLKQNPVFQVLGKYPRWTVSTKEKQPFSLKRTMRTCRFSLACCDADLMTLDKVEQNFPNENKICYHVNAFDDGIVVLDIEPTCPDDVKQELFKLPDLYRETSMSGKGVHMILPFRYQTLCDNMPKIKSVMKEKHGWYELLLSHYVTFTGKTLQHNNTTQDPDFNADIYDNFLIELAKQHQESIDYRSISEWDADHETTHLEHIMTRSCVDYYGQSYNKSLETDFNGDNSRYEASIGVTLAFYLKNRYMNSEAFVRFCKSHQIDPNSVDDNLLTYAIYNAYQVLLKHRAKHDTIRNHRPWLFYQAEYAINYANIKIEERMKECEALAREDDTDAPES